MTDGTENGDVTVPAQLSLMFKVFLVNAQTKKHTQEARTLRFWFAQPKDCQDNLCEENHAAVAQDFFRELVTPKEFPRGESCFSNLTLYTFEIMRRLCGIYQENHEVDAAQLLRDQQAGSGAQNLGGTG